MPEQTKAANGADNEFDCTNHLRSSFSTHASFQECVKSSSMITWTSKNNPDPNFESVSGTGETIMTQKLYIYIYMQTINCIGNRFSKFHEDYRKL